MDSIETDEDVVSGGSVVSTNGASVGVGVIVVIVVAVGFIGGKGIELVVVRDFGERTEVLDCGGDTKDELVEVAGRVDGSSVVVVLSSVEVVNGGRVEVDVVVVGSGCVVVVLDDVGKLEVDVTLVGVGSLVVVVVSHVSMVLLVVEVVVKIVVTMLGKVVATSVVVVGTSVVVVATSVVVVVSCIVVLDDVVVSCTTVVVPSGERSVCKSY